MTSLKNWWDHLCDLTTPLSRQFKDDLGWKAWLLEFLKQDDELSEHILPGFYITPQALNAWNIPDLPKEFQNGNLLYRSSNPHDAYDFIGQLPTLSGSSPIHTQTVYAIRDILAWRHLDSYLQRKNIPHQSEETGILIQNKINCSFRGSIVEHPHWNGRYIISTTNSSFWDDMHDCYMDMTIYTEEWEPSEGEFERRSCYPKEALQKLISLYRKIQRKGIFEEGISFQMEFGVDQNRKPYIFQARQFRPFEEANKADIRNLRGSNVVFWITPDEGIDLKLQVRHGMYAHDILDGVKEWVNGLVIPYLRQSINPEWLLDLRFFSLGGTSRPNLEHHVFDPAMKIPFVSIGSHILPNELQDSPTESEGQVFEFLYKSDGIRNTFSEKSQAGWSIDEKLRMALQNMHLPHPDDVFK